MGGGWLADRMLSNGTSLLFSRQFWNTIGTLAPSAFLIGATYGGDATVVVGLITAGVGMSGMIMQGHGPRVVTSKLCLKMLSAPTCMVLA
jgi:predicted permease